MEKVDLMSIAVTVGGYNNFIDTIIASARAKRNYYTCVANVHMMVEAYKNNNFANIVRNANIITPDGKPLIWALKILYGIKQDRVAGMDLLPNLLTAASNEGLSVYFYGGTGEILDNTRTFLRNYYPDLKVAGMYDPPFRPSTQEEEEEVIERINASGADIVFVVLGCPKQERWMSGVHRKINAVLIGVGGALPVVIGMRKRAPKWMQNTGFEWLFRLLQEPKRLFKRYAVTNSWFLFLLIREYFRLKVSKVALLYFFIVPALFSPLFSCS